MIIKNFHQYNEEITIRGVEHHFHDYKFQTGDICTYINPNDDKLNGKKCQIITPRLKIGNKRFMLLIKQKLNVYDIEFIEAFDTYLHLVYGADGVCQKDNIRRTKTPKKLRWVREDMLKLDVEATKEYREKEKELRIKTLKEDPYGEEEWEEPDKTQKFKLDYEETERTGKEKWVIEEKIEWYSDGEFVDDDKEENVQIIGNEYLTQYMLDNDIYQDYIDEVSRQRRTLDMLSLDGNVDNINDYLIRYKIDLQYIFDCSFSWELAKRKDWEHFNTEWSKLCNRDPVKAEIDV